MLQNLFTMCNVALNQKHLPEHKGTLWTLTDWVLSPPQHVNKAGGAGVQGCPAGVTQSEGRGVSMR